MLAPPKLTPILIVATANGCPYIAPRELTPAARHDWLALHDSTAVDIAPNFFLGN